MTSLKPTEKIGLDEVMNDVIQQLDNVTADSEEFEKMADQLVKLSKVKAENSPHRVSPDTLATIVANLAGIVMIVSHERTNIITSKALSFILKLR